MDIHLSGILSIFCIADSVIIILLLDRKVVSEWIPYASSIQPTVLLTILSASFNACQTLILAGEITVLWWRTVLRPTQLKTLYYIWNKGEWKGPRTFLATLDAGKEICYSGVVFESFDSSDWIVRGSMQRQCGGAGITANCSSTSEYVDISAHENTNATLFSLNFTKTTNSSGSPMLNMKLMFVSSIDSSCNVTFGSETCSIYAARVSYDVIRVPTLVSCDSSFGDSVFSKEGTPAGILAALEFIGYYYLRSNASLIHSLIDDPYSSEINNGILAEQYAGLNPNHFSFDGHGGSQWVNATYDIIRNMDEVTFRTAKANSNGTFNQYLEWTRTRPVLVYMSRYEVLWVASFIMVPALISSTSLLWGFWEVGREVSLSPLETARVFTDVVLKHADKPDMEMIELIQEIGKAKVRWRARSEADNSSLNKAEK
ncbi:hypothetical protein K469DRAFT_803722 [Zopfia rhizophila CBS 207.26]|uniref:Uncharacterized protein n=1 Tax=Zopfia rhizophila CBS 207.26 TaxID=1314779 RepID=A0A6A6DFV6_9PEZI|nr:hypothetical protein K469DRAFT_803722 [Zopfia rhizophila CBS 207.26]